MTPAPARFENSREMLIAGPNATYTMETRAGIPAQWERFAPHIGRVPGQIGLCSYGVCWNCRAGSGFDYLCGVEVSDAARVPPEFTQVRLPAGRYAVFVHDGHISALPATIDAIWTKWLPQSGLRAAPAPCFERYTEEFDPETGRGIEVWIPLQETTA